MILQRTLLAIGLAGYLVSGCTSDSGSAKTADSTVGARSGSTPVPRSTPSSVTSDVLQRAGACTAPCTITGQIPFNDPVSGPSTLVTVLNSSKGRFGESPGKGYIAAVSDGRLTWRQQLPGPTWWQLAPAPKPTDDTGHLFLNYNPGRYDGVIVLDPTGNGFDDYGSLPPGQDPGDWRFYSAVTVDPTHSGTLEIKTTIHYCVPDCARGRTTQVLWHWDGSDYTR